MKIKYASAHRWLKPVPNDALASFGKNSRARLRSALPKIAALPVRNEIAKLDEAFLERFLPRYEARIGEKRHPVVFDVRAKTLGSAKADRYYAMSLYEGDRFLGGTIFAIRKDRLAVAYRTYENAWHGARLQANPSLYVEYCLNIHAKEIGVAYIVHGKDRNPYGVNSNIGLAAFKLAAGCHAEIPRKFEIGELDTETCAEDALVLEYPGDEPRAPIRRAYLVTTAETEAAWTQVVKYPHLLSVATIYRTKRPEDALLRLGTNVA
ncbi:MAG TPA: hypothetical protein VFS75_03545 [Candidatus Paceibacterota bacterium]|nr:hypothetical protein [Candidatus Paceibacterota bacterium]